MKKMGGPDVSESNEWYQPGPVFPPPRTSHIFGKSGWVMMVLIIYCCKMAYDDSYDRSADCSSWEGGGSCETCSTYRGSRNAKQDLRAMCKKCRPGLVLLSGSEHNHSFTSPHGDSFHWDSHCAEPLEEERRVLIINHGQSTMNKGPGGLLYAGLTFGLVMGHDAPLSGLGLQQVQRFARVLKKANAEVYGSDLEPTVESRSKYDYSELSAARMELEKASLENVVITHEPRQRYTTEDESVQKLIDKENRLELEVLLGRKCEDTNFVSSPLTRAMDTLLIGTLERNMKCPTPFQISSNLQEITHGKDSSPNLQPGHMPAIVDEQRAQYDHEERRSALAYVEAAYRESNNSRHDSVKTAIYRAGVFSQLPEMQAELDATFSSSRKYSVWSGHSIWFREFLNNFADKMDNDCKAVASDKVLSYTAVVSVKLRTLKNSPKKYVASGCRFIHLGLYEDYTHSEKLDTKVNIASEL